MVAVVVVVGVVVVVAVVVAVGVEMKDSILHRYQVVNLGDEANVFATRSQKRPACVLAMALAGATGASWGVRDTLHKSGSKIVESYKMKNEDIERVAVEFDRLPPEEKAKAKSMAQGILGLMQSDPRYCLIALAMVEARLEQEMNKLEK